jgi:hypothetical protein
VEKASPFSTLRKCRGVGGAGWSGVGWTTLCLSTNATNGEGHAGSETPPGVVAPNDAKPEDRPFAKRTTLLGLIVVLHKSTSSWSQAHE